MVSLPSHPPPLQVRAFLDWPSYLFAFPPSRVNQFESVLRQFDRRSSRTLTRPYPRSNFEGNRAVHIETTGPEIHAQTKDLPGGLQAFICATGTGGTLAGVTRALKDLSGGKTQCWLADPPGSVLESFINRGVMERGGGSITEGELHWG